jgi:hypothetical protein
MNSSFITHILAYIQLQNAAEDITPRYTEYVLNNPCNTEETKFGHGNLAKLWRIQLNAEVISSKSDQNLRSQLLYRHPQC